MKKAAEEMQGRLEAIIEDYTGEAGPGTWEVWSEEGEDKERVVLAYKVPIQPHTEDDAGPHPLIRVGDEPWLLWGGNEILELFEVDTDQVDGELDIYDGYYYDMARIPI